MCGKILSGVCLVYNGACAQTSCVHNFGGNKSQDPQKGAIFATLFPKTSPAFMHEFTVHVSLEVHRLNKLLFHIWKTLHVLEEAVRTHPNFSSFIYLFISECGCLLRSVVWCCVA